MRQQLLITVLVASFTLSCSSLPELDVEEQWAEAMKKQSLYAIFPINEDLMVGDVLLDTRQVSSSDDDAFEVTRLARSDPDAVLAALCDDRRRRIEVLASPQQEASPRKRGYFKCSSLRAVRADARSRGARSEIYDNYLESVWSNGRLIGDADAIDADLRLTRSAIPQQTVARLTEAQLGASGLFGRIGANLGLNSTHNVGLTIKLSDLQSLELGPIYTNELLYALPRRRSAIKPNTVLQIMAEKWLEGTAHICRGEFSEADAMKVVILSRVDYAKEIHYEFSESMTAAVKTAIDLSNSARKGSQETAAIPNLPTNSITVSGAVNSPGADANLAASQQAFQAAVRQAAAGVSGVPNNPGASLEVVTGTLGSVALKETFDRPMAVGAGAKLIFRPEEALLPRTDDDVGHAMKSCGFILDEFEGSSGRPRFNAVQSILGRKQPMCRATDLPPELFKLRDYLCEEMRRRHGG